MEPGSEKIDIHVLIEEWNREPVAMPLHEYLGITEGAYGRWVEGGPLPRSAPVYDPDRKLSPAYDKLARKRARKLALEELAKLHRSDYLRLLNAQTLRLRAEARGD